MKHEQKTRQTAIIFDLDDTLLRTSEAIIPRAKENMRKAMTGLVPADVAQRILRRRAEIGIAEAIAAERLPARTARAIFEAHIVPLDEPFAYEDIAALDELRKTCRLFLVTRGAEAYQKEKIALHGLERQFERMLFIDGPKEEAFRRLIRDESLDPRRTFVVGDKYADELAAGVATGCTPILVARSGAPKSIKRVKTVVSLRELQDVVEGR